MRDFRYIALFFCLFCLFLSHAYADTTPVRILVGTSEMPLAPSPVHDGTRVLAPATVLERLGATAAYSGDHVTITAASGQSGTVKTVDVDGRAMLPMDKVMAIVGGEQAYDPAKRTLTLVALLESVEFDSDVLKINCSFPVRALVTTYNGNLIVDVIGAQVASEAKEVYIGVPAVERARLGQYNNTTARVVLELSKSTGYELQTQEASTQLLVKIADGLIPVSPPGVAAPALTVNGVKVHAVDDNCVDVVLSISKKTSPSHNYSVAPPSIVLGIPKARVDDNCAVTGAHSLVKPSLINTNTGVKVTLGLVKPMDYSVETSGTAITVHLRPLQKSGGTLASKLILIDPGHGGNQKGACAGGVTEKSLNTLLAKDLAAALAKEGAKTQFSRDSDAFMGQAARAQAAIDRGADFFISLHCNSSAVPNSATGIETYYHMQEPSPKTMAYLVHDGVCKTTGMCDRRARSDRDLYASKIGLGVLRTLSGSGVPGILLECGYINNTSDRAKLCDSGYRSKLVNGIVKGLKAYIEGTAVR